MCCADETRCVGGHAGSIVNLPFLLSHCGSHGTFNLFTHIVELLSNVPPPRSIHSVLQSDPALPHLLRSTANPCNLLRAIQRPCLLPFYLPLLSTPRSPAGGEGEWKDCLRSFSTFCQPTAVGSSSLHDVSRWYVVQEVYQCRWSALHGAIVQSSEYFFDELPPDWPDVLQSSRTT
jgi:hypothetical protein